MTERVINIIRRHSKKIVCIFDGTLLEQMPFPSIKKLIQKIEEMGSIRKNIVVFSRQLKPEEHESYIKYGISPIVVPSEKDIYLALESLNSLYTHQLDILCLGVLNDDLLPLVIDIRTKTDILLVIPNKVVAKNYEPYIDYSITTELID